MAYILLTMAIVSEVIGSSLLKVTNGFKNILPTIGTVLAYGIAFYGLSLALKTLPLGTAYGIWAGLGTALTVLVGIIIYHENINKHFVTGLLFIVSGVLLLSIG